MEYDFRQIEKKWQEHWVSSGAYRVANNTDRPKFYVLDMFPYPSGSGLHVGHPLGYIASDIYSRYKRLKGFNVLHPMGYDSFGLPAEQYALETGQHPAVTTGKNIATFRSQLDKIGFCYDWSREVRTSDPGYYRWTQWIFLQLFNSWYNRETGKAEPIDTLIPRLEGFDSLSAREQADLLMNYRLAYCSYGEVNWCEALGTVLANDEVVNGVSERGGFPVVKKKLRQWYLRITEYADRLLEGLNRIEFSEAMKEMQTNWIGKSSGAEIDFRIKTSGPLAAVPVATPGAAGAGPGTAADTAAIPGATGTVAESVAIPGVDTAAAEPTLRVYTTRPDTIFGVDFMVIAPEHELVQQITTVPQRGEVDEYLAYVQSRSERERMAEKKISGVFTGAYALNPFDGKEIPIWISEYVLAGYGTGAIMAVPCGDERDFKFARHFNIPITNIIGAHFNGEEANPTKDAVLENSGFLNGIKMTEAIGLAIDKIEELGIGKRKINYRMRDAAFSRQRYWGEPFPIAWKEGIATPLGEDELPLELPHVESYRPGPEGEGPLANIDTWTERGLETNTMPGYAGSSWYFLRFMDPANERAFCDRKVSDYWGQVDLYIGGTEHAVGHLLYSRMWTKVLYDLGYIGFDEPFKKLVNQGMITGVSKVLWRKKAEDDDLHDGVLFGSQHLSYHKVDLDKPYTQFYSADLIDDQEKENFTPLNIPVGLVDGDYADPDMLIEAWPERFDGVYVVKEGFFRDGQWYRVNEQGSVQLFDAGSEEPPGVKVESVVEKMSKSKLNTENPDDVIRKYGADTFRMYEMFLGPIEMSKPWDTKGIEGVHRFLKKLWRLFYDETRGKVWTEDAPSDAEWKLLHRTIKKIEEDNERFSFNTGVSTFMICVNELHDLRCHKKAILVPLLILLSPYAPHVTQELWTLTGHEGLVLDAAFPVFDQKYLVETSKVYPVSVNGKVRAQLELSMEASQSEVEQAVISNETVQKWLDGKPFKKVIYVKGKMINVVV